MSGGRRWGRTSAVLGTGNCTDASQCLGAGCSFVQSPPSPVFVQKPLGFGWRLAFCTAGEGSCVSGSQLRPPCAGPGRGRKRTRLLLSVSGPLWGCAVASPFPAPRRGAGAQHRSPPPPGAMAACTPAGRAGRAGRLGGHRGARGWKGPPGVQPAMGVPTGTFGDLPQPGDPAQGQI